MSIVILHEYMNTCCSPSHYPMPSTGPPIRRWLAWLCGGAGLLLCTAGRRSWAENGAEGDRWGSTDENMEKTMKNVEHSHFKRNNKGNMMKHDETWWKMMKDDERWWCLFSLLASRVSHFQTKPDRKGRKEMKHAKKHLCKESTWRKWTASFKFGGLQSLPCTPMYINSRLHCRSIEQAGLCCSNIKWVHWTGLNAGGTVTSFIGQKRVWSRLDKWWSPGHTGSLCFFCFIA